MLCWRGKLWCHQRLRFYIYIYRLKNLLFYFIIRLCKTRFDRLEPRFAICYLPPIDYVVDKKARELLPRGLVYYFSLHFFSPVMSQSQSPIYVILDWSTYWMFSVRNSSIPRKWTGWNAIDRMLLWDSFNII